MKTIFQVAFIIVMLLNNHVAANAQQTSHTGPIFSGIFKNYTGTDSKSFVIGINEDLIWGTTVGLNVEVEKNGKFQFQLPKNVNLIKITIAILHAGKSRVLNNYYVEPNDRIYIEVINTGQRDSAIFHGNGAEKYNIIEQLRREEVGFINNHSAIKLVDKAESIAFSQFLQQQLDLMRKSKATRLSIINKARTLDSNMRKILRCEYVFYKNQWTNLLKSFYMKYSDNEMLRTLIKQYYNRYKEEFLFKPDSICLSCPAYFRGLLIWEKANLYLSQQDTAKIHLNMFYDSIKNKYLGLINDRFLAEFILNPWVTKDLSSYTNSEWDLLVNDAIDRISAPAIKEKIGYKVKTQKGTKLLTSEFIDLDGNRVNTSTLRGKAFLIDVWFLGCSGCANFHERFKKRIYPAFKNNEDLTILSLNVNDKKEDWITGLNSNKYTSKDYLNVTTGAVAWDHPFIKYYNIQGGPYLLLVDKNGAIYAQPSVALSDRDLINWINNAINVRL